MAKFRGDYPTVMVNWRSLVLDWYPEIYWRSGILLTMGLGLLTSLCIAWIWRGSWNVAATDFPEKMSLTFLATVIVSYHSHPYGPAILIMPLAAAMHGRGLSCLDRYLIWTGAIVPTIILVCGYGDSISDWDWTVHLEFASQVLKAIVFAFFVSKLVSLIGRETRGHRVFGTVWRPGNLIPFLRIRPVQVIDIDDGSPDGRRASNE